MKDLASALGDLRDLRAQPPRQAPAAKPAGHASIGAAPVGASAEQREVVDCQARCVRVVALAGTGKTEVLAAYARARSRARLRYLSFNRAMARSAATRLPSTVVPGTFHSLAFSRFGSRTSHKVALPWDASHAAAWLGLPVPMARAPAALDLVRRTLDGFLLGDAAVLGVDHVPVDDWLLWQSLDPSGKVFPGLMAVVHAAEHLWRLMLDPSSSCPVSPDAWVKLAQLGAWQPAGDGWLVDEAQDLSPAMLAWLRLQPGLQVTAGDPHQAIYAFRTPAAWTAEACSANEARIVLSHSFRFGPGLATEINRVLARMGAMERVVGVGGPGKVSHLPPPSAATALCRSQAGAWAWARRAAPEGWSVASTPRPPERWVSLAALRRGDRSAITDPWVRSFQSYEALREAARSCPREWAPALAYVEGGWDASSSSTAGPSLDLLTVHQAKGLTLECVWMGPDFRLPRGNPSSWSVEEAEEARIAYVASSRARHALHIHERMAARWEEWLAHAPATPPAPPAPVVVDDGF